MDKCVNKLHEFVEYLEKQDTKIAKNVWDFYNHDNIDALIEYNETWWIEHNISVEIPKYVFNYINKYYKRKGFKWVFDK